LFYQKKILIVKTHYVMPILEANFNTRILHLVTTPRADNDPCITHLVLLPATDSYP